MRSWRQRLSPWLAAAPGLPDARRLSAAATAANSLEHEGRSADAVALLERAAQRSGPETALELRARAASISLRAGVVPAHVDEVTAALLDAADAAWEREDRAATARRLGRVAALTFDRVRHLDPADSPLASEPAAFLAPLRASRAWSGLTAPRGRFASPPVRGHGPLTVVAVTDHDRRFLDPLMAAVRDLDPDITVRVLDLASWASAFAITLPLTPGEQVAARLLPDASGEEWADALTRELADADVVWVDWTQRAAVLVSLLDLGVRRVVVRLHSFEAFTVFPHLVDPSRVDDVVVVSPAFHGLLAAQLPTLGAGEKRVHVIANAIDGSGITTEKTAEASRTLGLVGWASPAKDAVWALDVLAALRAEDDRWRLRLVGAAPRADGKPGEAAYAHRVSARLAADDVAGAVDLIGQSDDVASELRHIGVILSSSTRESFHVALAEGVASGALPVVRDWPLLAAYGGPRGLWPDGWIVATPPDAAQRIRDAVAGGWAPGEDSLAGSLPDPAHAGRLARRVIRGI
jgi:glycosyltransferase involved in cell wall biosynthesis